MVERHLQISATLEQIQVACEFVAEAAREAGLDERAVYRCQLSVDEACTNIVEHGYGMHGADQIIDVYCQTDAAQRFLIHILDDSPAFNPLTLPPPDPQTPLEDRALGGWGIHFIKKLMDEISYSRIDNRNCLELVKYLG